MTRYRLNQTRSSSQMKKQSSYKTSTEIEPIRFVIRIGREARTRSKSKSPEDAFGLCAVESKDVFRERGLEPG